MKIYAVSSITNCDYQYDLYYNGYPIFDTLKYFSTEEKAKTYIEQYKCKTIHTLFRGDIKAREIPFNISDEFAREFITDDEDYDYYRLLLYIEEIEIE